MGLSGVIGHEHQIDGCAGDRTFSDLSGDSCGSLDLGGLWEVVNAGFFGSSQGVLWHSEDAADSTSDAPEASDNTEISYFPVSRRRARPGGGRQLIDEFLDERERAAFGLLYDRVRSCWAADASSADRLTSLAWVFTLDGGDGPSFDLCCRALGIRPNVIRLRINYQWYSSGHAFTNPIGFWQVALPSEVEGDLLYWGGETAVRLAEKAWRQPGIRELAENAEELEMCWMLESRGLLGECCTGWYVVGRNPTRIAYTERGWSALW